MPLRQYTNARYIPYFKGLLIYQQFHPAEFGFIEVQQNIRILWTVVVALLWRGVKKSSLKSPVR